MERKLAIVILAAGKGTRMRSEKAKALHELVGQPLIKHVVKLSLALNPDYLGVVLGHQGQKVKEALEDFNLEFLYQEEQLGTGHALMQAERALKDFQGDVLVLYTDMPLLKVGTIRALLEAHSRLESVGTVLTADLDNPEGYGRIIRQEENGLLKEIVEERDLPQELEASKEINTGSYVFSAPEIFKALKQVSNVNSQNEYYLTDVISIWQRAGKKVAAFKIDDSSEAMGINNQMELAKAEKIMRQEIIRKHMLNGVKIVDPANTYIEMDVEIDNDTVIWPGTFLKGQTKIASHCEIGPFTTLIASQVRENSHVHYSYCCQAIIGSNSSVGPFAHLRPGTRLLGQARVGNFVEIKESTIGLGSKIAHLSYVGDAQLGESCNIGAGTVVANYDGRCKHKTEIEANVFIASNTTLVAPVKLGKGARTGAGAVVTKDVQAGTTVVGVPARALVKDKKQEEGRK